MLSLLALLVQKYKYWIRRYHRGRLTGKIKSCARPTDIREREGAQFTCFTSLEYKSTDTDARARARTRRLPTSCNTKVQKVDRYRDTRVQKYRYWRTSVSICSIIHELEISVNLYRWWFHYINTKSAEVQVTRCHVKTVMCVKADETIKRWRSWSFPMLNMLHASCSYSKIMIDSPCLSYTCLIQEGGTQL